MNHEPEKSMPDLTLSVEGVQVPRFLYGTAWKEDQTQRLTGRALQQGFRGIDTANQRRHYHEAAVGQAIVDLRAFLQTALPRGKSFPDWRSAKQSTLQEWLDLPRQGILFDIEYNGFWLEEWADAKRIASELVAAAPKLIPVFGHRMIPDEPHLVGNPVFSVHQTDIIHYGFDLADYLQNEFHLPGREPWPDSVRAIRFWDLVAGGSCVFDNRKGQLP